MNELSVVVTQGKIEVLHYEELKAEVIAKVSHYQTLAITEDDLPSCKIDLASLRKLDKALNDERIAKEKEYLQPWMFAKSQIDELRKPIKEAIDNIDKQMKDFELEADKKKLEDINALWASKHFALIPFAKLYDARWLNKGFSMADISKAMDGLIKKVNEDFDIIEKLLGKDNDEAINETWAIYKESPTLNAAEALATQKQRSEARKLADTQRNALKAQISLETPKTEQIKQTDVKLITARLEISGTYDQLVKLKQYISENGMSYKKI